MLAKIRENNDWQAEDDACILERAEEVKRDKLRYAKAVNAAKFLVKEREKHLNALRKIVGKSGKTSNSTPASYGDELFLNSINDARR